MINPFLEKYLFFASVFALTMSYVIGPMMSKQKRICLVKYFWNWILERSHETSKKHILEPESVSSRSVSNCNWLLNFLFFVFYANRKVFLVQQFPHIA